MIEIFVASYNGRTVPSEVSASFGSDGGTIGRGTDNRLVLADPARHVSRLQARIRYEAGRYLLANVSAANPIFVNDIEVESSAEVPISPGDELRVGLYVLGVRQLIDLRAPGSPITAAPGSGAAPVIRGPLDPLQALSSAAPAGSNPFADLIGPVASASTPNTPAPDPVVSGSWSVAQNPLSFAVQSPPDAKDPFADLLGGSVAPDDMVAPSSGSTADPFVALFGTGGTAATPKLSNVGQQGPSSVPADPWAQDSRHLRNTDDPLRGLSLSAVELNDPAHGRNENSLIDFAPGIVDPQDPLQGGTPSVLDAKATDDPLAHLIHGDDSVLIGLPGFEASRPAAPMRDDRLDLRDIVELPRIVPGPGVTGTTRTDPSAVTPARVPPPSASPVLVANAQKVESIRPAAAATFTASNLTSSAAASPSAAVAPSGVVAEAGAVPTDVTQDRAVLLAAFVRGAQIEGFTAPVQLTPAVMEMLGSIVRHAIAGAMELVAARQITKREMRAEVTIIVPKGNNPLKFLPTPEAVMMQMLGPPLPGFKPTAGAVQEVFDDLCAHEMGVIAGMRAALSQLLLEFDPTAIEKALPAKGPLDSLVQGARHAKLWKLFQERFRAMQARVQDDAQLLFGDAFTEAYEQEVARGRQHRDGSN